MPPAEARKAIADVLAVVPRERETETAIAAFQRQVQLHHTTAQQIEILSRTVLKLLDHRAEAHVRTAVLRAFGITAISPTALSDAAFFLAFGVRMVRGIAASYGHRPTTATTVHLLRRLVLEAGKLGAVDIASTRWCSISAARWPSGSPPARPTRSMPPIAWRGSASSSWTCAGRSRSAKTSSQRHFAGRQRAAPPHGAGAAEIACVRPLSRQHSVADEIFSDDTNGGFGACSVILRRSPSAAGQASKDNGPGGATLALARAVRVILRGSATS